MSTERKEDWPPGLLDHRQVIPRWHSPAVAAWSGEQSGFLTSSAPRTVPPRWKLQSSASSETIPHEAVEREELAFLLGQAVPDVPVSAQLVRLRTNWQRAIDRSSALTALPSNGETLQNDHRSVHHLRRRLADQPNQALLWTELSRHYLILGEESKATRAMECGLKLGTASVYVTRAAARLFTHVADTDRALQVVRTHPHVRRDPRLLSAEVALSSMAGVGSLHAKIAAKMIEDTRYRPKQLADLTAALATIELEHGKHKAARRLFEKTFPTPTENSLAQAQWATTHDTKIIIPDIAWTTPHSFEAQALASRTTRDWDKVVESTEKWLNTERFSLQPAMLGSFAFFSLAQNERAENLATAGLQANPGTVGLYNNRAVARALLGRPQEAIGDIKEGLRFGGSGNPYLIATLGMVAYRSGYFTLGATCYGTAVADFVASKDKSTLAYAILMWLRERILAGDPQAAEDYTRIKPRLIALTRKGREPEVESVIELLEADLRKPRLLDINNQWSSVSHDYLHQTFTHFKPDRDVVTLRDRFLEEL